MMKDLEYWNDDNELRLIGETADSETDVIVMLACNHSGQETEVTLIESAHCSSTSIHAAYSFVLL